MHFFHFLKMLTTQQVRNSLNALNAPPPQYIAWLLKSVECFLAKLFIMHNKVLLKITTLLNNFSNYFKSSHLQLFRIFLTCNIYKHSLFIFNFAKIDYILYRLLY